jgi:hypothetical protein
VHRQSDIARLQKAPIATLSNMKRYNETIAQAYQYIVRRGEDLTMLDALKVAYFYTGKTEEAIRYGQRALEIRDAESCANPPNFTVIEPKGPPSGQNVMPVCYSGPTLSAETATEPATYVPRRILARRGDDVQRCKRGPPKGHAASLRSHPRAVAGRQE